MAAQHKSWENTGLTTAGMSVGVSQRLELQQEYNKNE